MKFIEVNGESINPEEIAAIRTLFEKSGYGDKYASGSIIILKNGERIEVPGKLPQSISKLILESK